LKKESLLRKSILYPFLFVALLWIIQLLQSRLKWDMSGYGIRPRTMEGLLGIITGPLVHANYDHLLSNTLPLLVVGTGLIYFYQEIAFRVMPLIYLFTGCWVWIAARPDSHIGASGLIYGFVCFLFFSGIFRKDRRLLAISLLVTFLYGSMVWGILPVDQTISWESHLFGSVAGVLCAVFFRKEGPQMVQYTWEEEEDSTGDEFWKEENQNEQKPPDPPVTINYLYKEEDKNPNGGDKNPGASEE